MKERIADKFNGSPVSRRNERAASEMNDRIASKLNKRSACKIKERTAVRECPFHRIGLCISLVIHVSVTVNETELRTPFALLDQISMRP